MCNINQPTMGTLGCHIQYPFRRIIAFENQTIYP